jgi:2-octaprenyl-6-methoxyphenol hydroxylase
MYEIAIVGNGLVGVTLAYVLHHLGYRCILFGGQYPRDQRSLALSLQSLELLTTLQITNDLFAHAPLVQTIHLSKQAQLGQVVLQAAQYQLPAFGKMIAADTLYNDLVQTLPCAGPIDLSCITWHAAATRPHWQLGQYQAQLLIAADGANSPLRERYLGSYQASYSETALVANLQANIYPEHYANTAYERLTQQQGIVACLPLGPGQYKCVWTLSHHVAQDLLQKSPAGFLQALHTVFGHRLLHAQLLSPVSYYPVIGLRAKQLVGAQLLLIGNAALSLHPLGAQNFNLALRDIHALQQLLPTLLVPASAWEPTQIQHCLYTYQERRALDHQRTWQFVQRLYQLFHWQAPVASLYSLGLALANCWVPGRQAYLAAALGGV